jgi:cobalt/nickel transport protein
MATPEPTAGETNTHNSSFSRRYWWLIGIVVALAVVFVLAPAASSDPDGLDRVGEDEGFAEQAEEPRYEWLPDYTIPGIDDEYWSTVLAGAAGVGIIFVAVWGLGFVLSKSRGDRAA